MKETRLSTGELTSILDRIALHRATGRDLMRLRSAVTVDGDRNVVQVGSHNVQVDRAHDIHIGDRVYQGPDAEAIRDVLREVAERGPGPLTGVGGVVLAIGYTIMVIGMAVFGLTIVAVLANFGERADGGMPKGPPLETAVAFGVAVVGGLVAELGKVIQAWQRRSRAGQSTFRSA